MMKRLGSRRMSAAGPGHIVPGMLWIRSRLSTDASAEATYANAKEGPSVFG